MSRNRIILLIVLILLLVGVAFFWKNIKGILPVVLPPPSDITEQIPSDDFPVINTTGMPLKIPNGFAISIFAKDLPDARVIIFDTFGNAWVSQPEKGVVSLIEMEGDKVNTHYPVLKNLRKPHGIAFDPAHPQILYVAEENKISRLPTYSDGELEKLVDLPYGAGHSTRTIGFSPDGTLFLSIGSSCNVCHESNEKKAKIFTLDTTAGTLKEFARGLRNSVFFVWHPDTKKMWATDMGRDLLGDNTPPDEVNIIEEGKNYGWPNCYGKNIHDDSFDKNTYIRNPCMEPFETESAVDIPAHSAPLGLAFVPKGVWQKEYDGNLLVALHGSWDRSEPTGYKIVRIQFDKDGKYLSTEDFISGWLVSEGALGRPVDLVFHNGVLYITDDKAGVIYSVSAKQVQNN